MKKILLFLLSMCLFSCGDFGVSSNTEDTSGSSIEEIAAAFYEEYQKYVINADGTLYTGEFSEQAIDSIYAIIENVTGYGMMPSNVGIGEVTDTEIAQAFGKLVATYKLDDGSLLSYNVILYDNLDVDENTFITNVMGVFMNENGSLLLADLENMNRDYEAIITLADLIETSAVSGASGADSTLSRNQSRNMRANIVYTATTLIQYITSDNLGIASRRQNTLPYDEDLLNSLSSAFISVIYATDSESEDADSSETDLTGDNLDATDDESELTEDTSETTDSTIDLTVDTPDFDVSLIYTDEFISTLAPIFQDYYNNN